MFDKSVLSEIICFLPKVKPPNYVNYIKNINQHSLEVYVLFYALFNSKRNLSAIIAINSEFVGLPFAADTVYPNIFSTMSC